MSTPYDNHDPGYSREERRIAESFDLNLDTAEVKCQSCFKYTEPAELNANGDCPACVELMRAEEAVAWESAICGIHGAFYSGHAACPTCAVMRDADAEDAVLFMTSARPTIAGLIGLMGV